MPSSPAATTYDRNPDWVVDWNAKALPFAYAGQAWELLETRERYANAERDDLPYETELPGFGRVFPHPFGPADGKLFTTLLTISPAGDELTLAFAKDLIEAEDLGADDVPDYLSISLSSTDYVGHVFGPSSLETEDLMLRLDRMLADLLAFIDQRIGLADTLIVLSADHGAADPPGYLNELGIPARYIDPKSWNTAPGLARLQARFGLGEELIAEYFHPYVYLNQDAIIEAVLDQREVEAAVTAELMALPGIALAISSSALEMGDHPDTALLRSILHNHHPARSGDVFVVFEPHAFINDFDGLTVAAHHGSPWSYDTFVPLILAGNGLSPKRVARRVETVDLAPTLSAYLGIKAPSGASGHLLREVLVDHQIERKAEE